MPSLSVIRIKVYEFTYNNKSVQMFMIVILFYDFCILFWISLLFELNSRFFIEFQYKRYTYNQYKEHPSRIKSNTQKETHKNSVVVQHSHNVYLETNSINIKEKKLTIVC